jgi:hypothetical protein
MPRSEHLADMSTHSLRDEREACLRLATADYCSDSVKEFHADYADQISDEIDRRKGAIQ